MLGPAPKDADVSEREADDGRHPIRKGLQASAWRSFERHAEPDWPEWAAREFLRLCYIVFFMAVAIVGGLQIEYSLLPQNAPPVLDPTLVDVLALVYVVGVISAVAYGYYCLWRSEGYVDRWAAKRQAAAAAVADDEGRGEA